MIDRLPKCLQTCLHCCNAVIVEEYSASTRKLVFDGCWCYEDIRLPVAREDCRKFEESRERTERKFWEKWNWKVYVDGNLIHHEQPGRGSDEICEQPKGHDEPYELFKTADEIYSEQGAKGHTEICEQPKRYESSEQSQHDSTGVVTNAPDTRTNTKEENSTTRALILQALANSISRLKEIAHFAGVDPSTAHYHLKNLVREERVTKTSWGHYVFSGTNSLDNGKFFESSGRTFEKLLKNFSHPGRGSAGSAGLHPVEKNILMDILSKENKYNRFSERELARRSNVSRYAVKKYTQNLEKKRLITIKREDNQLVFTPTELAINGLTHYFHSVKTGSKTGSESSKIQPVDGVSDPQSEPAGTSENTTSESPGTYGPTENPLETFDDYLAWQQKNAHRLIIQFKLIRCDHPRLKRTGWIFGQKSIHKHFTEAYIYKSKDPTGEFINVLPKHPFIFTSPFEFEDQTIAFVNEVIDRLREYGITIDLSEPAEIKMEHAALEDNIFARKVIKKKVLYFKSKVQTVDSTGEVIEYVIAIDKSKALHLECEGTEAHHFMENCEEFIDDIATKRIDPKLLRELPEELTKIKKGIKENKEKQTSFDENLKVFSDTIEFYSENIRTHIDAMTSLTESVDQLTEATKRIEKAANTVEKAAEALIEATELLKKTLEGKTVKTFFSKLLGGII